MGWIAINILSGEFIGPKDKILAKRKDIINFVRQKDNDTYRSAHYDKIGEGLYALITRNQIGKRTEYFIRTVGPDEVLTIIERINGWK